MDNFPVSSITKSDFQLYCKAPLHLWAKKNGRIIWKLSDFDKHLIEQGYQVEALAREYLETMIKNQGQNHKIIWQETNLDGLFEARADAFIFYTRNKFL